MSIMIDVEEEGTQALIAAIVRQAITDYQNNYTHRHHPDAAEFLQEMGLVESDNVLEMPGYAMVPIATPGGGQAVKQRALRRASRGNGLPRSTTRVQR